MKRHFHMLISAALAVMQGLLWIVHPFYRRLTSPERRETINSKQSILVFLLACLATILQFPLFIWYLSISNTSESLYIRLQGILAMWLAEILCVLSVSSQINVPVLQLEACAQQFTLPNWTGFWLFLPVQLSDWMELCWETPSRLSHRSV